MLTITSPYPYQELKRKSIDGKRLYENPWGDPVPSVTTILDKTKPKEKREALNNWKQRVGEQEAQRVVTEAANTGTYMHAILEHWVKNELYTGDATVQSRLMADTVIKNIEPHITEVWGSEVNLCYPGLYAGTTDLVGMWKGKSAILDFKQTNKPKKREWIEDYFLQLTAYGLAHNELYKTNITSGAIFMCSRECEFQLFEITENEWEKYSLLWTKRIEQYYNM
jgi:ATP-dependent exoDNAse (exonuclease V) beta subunit